jgi:hypothetical protein
MYLFFSVKNNFVESHLLATIGLYQKGKKVTLVIEKSVLLFFNPLISQVRKFESIDHKSKGRSSFIQIGFNGTSIN